MAPECGHRTSILEPIVPLDTTPLELERFLPYRISQLANTLHAALANAYATRFALTIPEWRVMCALALRPGLSAAQVARQAGMDKVAVSRAVASLTRARRVERSREESDRRRSNLQLTPRGWSLYAEVVPWSLAYERALLRGMTARNREKLDQLLDAVMERARSVRADRIVAKKP
jgi:DNA-binding MarR family transcriptional regulator